ncbi:MAG: c-type cytochrome [Magnetococcales bacterium]|nr:c-type cytochrome [Magnetococcales bacterium]
MSMSHATMTKSPIPRERENNFNGMAWQILFFIIALSLWPQANAADAFDPAKVYTRSCSVCHGVRGDAQTTVASSMVPPPTVFTNPDALIRLTPENMAKAIAEGKKGTAMPGWAGRYSAEEIKSLVGYIQNTFMMSSGDKSASVGRRIFAQNCSVCHGDRGDKAQWAQSGLNPQPRDFTTEKARKELTRERMIFSVTFGRPDTAMPAWEKRFSKEEIEAVVDYIRGAFLPPEKETPKPPVTNAMGRVGQQGTDKAAAHKQHDHTAHWDLVEIAKPIPFNLVGDARAGKIFFNKNCYVCHGEKGDGKGPRSDFIDPKPRNFLHPASRHKFSREHLFFTISDGINGTEMSAWKSVLTQQQMANVAEYVFQTFILPGLPEGYFKNMAEELRKRPMVSHHGMGHNHPGLPFGYILPVLILMPILVLWALWYPPSARHPFHLPLTRVPVVAGLVRFLNASPQPLAMLKMLTLAAYLLVIVAGFWGTSAAEHNFATVLVWGLWWPLVIISVFFVGSAWCAICPWETLAKLVVFRRIWRRPAEGNAVVRRVPAAWRNVYPALLLFVGLTWLELGAGVTSIPWATAGMALIMFLLATTCLVFFERKAFCRYFCPVGRTIGYYSRLAPIEIRPSQEDVCINCKTLECYNGTRDIEPCPTHLTLGRFGENTFCISCGSCVLSCPYKNVTWRLRSMASEAINVARPHWDGAWFMIGLLAITVFHGITMLSSWSGWITTIKTLLGESDPPYVTFTLLLLLTLAVVAAVYSAAIVALRLITPTAQIFRNLFSQMAFVNLPLAFVYHLAHNLDHFLREKPDFFKALLNPLGVGTRSLSSMERHMMMMEPAIPEWMIFSIQTLLMAFGFWLAIQIVRYRTKGGLKGGGDLAGWRLLPVYLYAVLVTGFTYWLLGQDMVMRL